MAKLVIHNAEIAGHTATDNLRRWLNKSHKGIAVTDYTSNPNRQWHLNEWISTYQNLNYLNIPSIEIAFAPLHVISQPVKGKKRIPETSCSSPHKNAFGCNG